MYDVSPHLKEARAREIFAATKASEPNRLQDLNWTPGDMDLRLGGSRGLEWRQRQAAFSGIQP